MSSNTIPISQNDFKFPIRSLQYVEVPYHFGNTKTGDTGVMICDQTITKLIVIVEANATRLGQFTFICPGSGLYTSAFTYVLNGYNYNVNFKFIDGHDSFLYVTERHYQTEKTKLFSKNEIIDEFQSIPTFIEIARG